MVRKSIVLLFLALPLFAFDDITRSRTLGAEARTAYQAGNFELFLEKAAAAAALRPGHQTILLTHARGLALNKRPAEALDVLDAIAAMGMVIDIAKIKDLESLHGDARWGKTLAAFQANSKPRGTSKIEATIPDKAIIAEGLAWDRRNERLFLSSVRRRSIYVIEKGGEPKLFSGDLPWGPYGLSWDEKRGMLWAVLSASPFSEGVTEKEKASVVAIDGSGRVVKTFTPADEKPHAFGDLYVSNDYVYVSDSRSPVIYRIAAGRIEPFVEDPRFISLQGLTRIGNTLYAADYAAGIFAIDLATRAVSLLPVAAGATVLGVDGLYATGDRSLIATQNGTNPNRVIRINLSPRSPREQIASVDVLAASLPEMHDPTLGVLAGSRFFFIANGQWDLYGEDGKLKAEATGEPTRVLSVAVR